MSDTLSCWQGVSGICAMCFIIDGFKIKESGVAIDHKHLIIVSTSKRRHADKELEWLIKNKLTKTVHVHLREFE